MSEYGEVETGLANLDRDVGLQGCRNIEESAHGEVGTKTCWNIL